MNSSKIGIFLPRDTQISSNISNHVHSSLTSRMPEQESQALLELIHNDRSLDLIEIPNFDNIIIVNDTVFYKDISLNDLDIFFWYGEIGRESGTYSLDALKTLAKTTKVVPDPYRFEVGVDKYLSHLVLKRNGINVPDFLLLSTQNIHLARPILEEWGCGLLKPRKGGFGKGITLINSFPMLRDIIEYVDMESFYNTGARASGGMLLERYYENSLDRFVSATLIDGEIMYGYRKRLSKQTDLGHGLKKIYDFNGIGGEVDICDVSPTHQKQALKAHLALGAEVIGFDMIWHNDRPIIIDENTFPGLYVDLFEQQGISLAKKMYNLILKHVSSSHVEPMLSL